MVLSLLPGRYTLLWTLNGRVFASPLSVPDLPAITLADALGIGAGHVPVVGAIIPPGDPGQVVGYDAAGRPVAMDMVAASLPPGQSGQLLGYGPGGTPVAVDAPASELSFQQW